jgi:FkbM family methyltransferase
MISYSQNGEDVVLNRVLSHVEIGTYIDIGAGHPTEDSVTKNFYDRGWFGINIEPDDRFYPLYEVERILDHNIKACVSNEKGEVDYWQSTTQGWSTSNKKVALDLTEIEFVSKEKRTAVSLDQILDMAKSEVNFLKIDCEGGEYDTFTSENLPWIKQNVEKIAGEFHLNNDYLANKFIEFRDSYLKEFNNYQVYSWDGVDIKWNLWDDNFVKNFNEINIYIDNRKVKKNYWKVTPYPTLEFTTSIPPKGCVIDCAFCPQRTLLNVYDSDKTMTLENFKKVIDKLNPDSIKVISSKKNKMFYNN